MEGLGIAEIINMVGVGPLAAILILAKFFFPWYKRDVRARETENMLRACQIEALMANLNFLKEHGYDDIQIPDLTKVIAEQAKG